ncbi:MAG: response regulator, partial [Limisphaerales bacterium]
MPVAATILIVDDEPRNCDLLEAILKREGYHLVVAMNGQEALLQTLDHKPDLVLLDVMMPDINGYEVCETIRADPDLAEIPVIMITALDDRDSRLKGIEAGADDFLTKPVDSLDLKARVKTVTRLNRYRRLKAEREKFEKIADFASDALLLLRDDNTIAYSNSKARQLLQRDGEIVGRNFNELSEKKFIRRPPEAWGSWIGSAQPDETHLRYLVRPQTAKGPTMWLRALAFRLPATGGGDWLVRLQDVTGLMQQKRDMWNFHRMLSHKMRTPLNGLIGSLSVLTEAAELTPDDASIAGDAMESAVRLESQVTEVLRYLDASKISQEGDQLDGAELEGKAEAVVHRIELAETQIEVADELSDLSFRISSLAMDVVLSELLDNAKKFHPDSAPKIL